MVSRMLLEVLMKNCSKKAVKNVTILIEKLFESLSISPNPQHQNINFDKVDLKQLSPVLAIYDSLVYFISQHFGDECFNYEKLSAEGIELLQLFCEKTRSLLCNALNGFKAYKRKQNSDLNRTTSKSPTNLAELETYTTQQASTQITIFEQLCLKLSDKMNRTPINFQLLEKTISDHKRMYLNFSDKIGSESESNSNAKKLESDDNAKKTLTLRERFGQPLNSNRRNSNAKKWKNPYDDPKNWRNSNDRDSKNKGNSNDRDSKNKGNSNERDSKNCRKSSDRDSKTYNKKIAKSHRNESVEKV